MGAVVETTARHSVEWLRGGKESGKGKAKQSILNVIMFFLFIDVIK